MAKVWPRNWRSTSLFMIDSQYLYTKLTGCTHQKNVLALMLSICCEPSANLLNVPSWRRMNNVNMSTSSQKNKDSVEDIPVPEHTEHNSSFTRVPDDIIRTVASYLEEDEYGLFSIASKHHLSVCRSPNMMQILSFAENDKLSDYPRIRSLHM